MTELIGAALCAAGAISTIAAAGNWLVRLVQALKAPNDAQNRRLTALEKHMEEVDSYLARDKKRLDSIDESTRVTQRALLAHGIDGNHRSQMEEAKLELEEHLIKK